MGVLAAFIDGGYLDKVLQLDFNNARIDYEQLVAKMAAPHELLRAYYYHCLPYQANPPSEDEKKHYGAKHKREGVVVTLWHGGGLRESNRKAKATDPSRELREICDECRQLTDGLIGQISRD